VIAEGCNGGRVRIGAANFGKVTGACAGCDSTIL
jgi:hypothetical protein